jgi:hypothetical protein
MAYENFWPQVESNLSATGGADGRVSLSSTYGFYVRQKVTLSSGSSVTVGEVKEVLSPTVLRVGPDNGQCPGTAYNLASFNPGGKLFAPYQPIVYRGNGNVPQIVYENEPVKALRVINVDELGNTLPPTPSFQYIKVANSTITAGNASITQAYTVGSFAQPGRIFAVLSTLDVAVGVSLNGVQVSELNSGESFGYDLYSNGRLINASTTIGVWNVGSTSTTGSIRFQIVS